MTSARFVVARPRLAVLRLAVLRPAVLRPALPRPALLGLAVLGSVALATGCGQPPSAPGGTGGESVGERTFLSTAVTEHGVPRELAEGTRVSLRFTGDGRLLADAGCNTMAGPVTVGDGRLRVSDLSTTDMGCDPPRHQQDEWLAAFLTGGPSWRLSGTDLTLRAADTELVLVDREVAQPDLPLTGTAWTVDTIVTGTSASTPPAGATATLVFGADRVTVDTGCNAGSAGYQVSGQAIVFTRLVVTRKGCVPELASLERAVLAALSGRPAFEIDADRLVLTPSDGTELQLRGRPG